MSIKARQDLSITIMSSTQQIQKKIKSVSLKTSKPRGDFSSTTIKLDGRPLVVKLTGELFYEPTRSEHKEYGVSIKFGVKFEEADCLLFDQLLDLMDADIAGEWTRKESHEDGSMFLKLKFNAEQTEFKGLTCNVPIKPLKLASDKIERGMDVTVELAVGGWLLHSDEKYGLSFTVKSLYFGKESKKKRKDDEEVILA